MWIFLHWASLVAQMVIYLQCRRFNNSGWIPGLGRFLEKGMATHSSFLYGEFHGQRSLAGYSPWGHKQSDMTEWLTKTCSYNGTLYNYKKKWIIAISIKASYNYVKKNIAPQRNNAVWFDFRAFLFCWRSCMYMYAYEILYIIY